jgi:hypothetical protein
MSASVGKRPIGQLLVVWLIYEYTASGLRRDCQRSRLFGEVGATHGVTGFSCSRALNRLVAARRTEDQRPAGAIKR